MIHSLPGRTSVMSAPVSIVSNQRPGGGGAVAPSKVCARRDVRPADWGTTAPFRGHPQGRTICAEDRPMHRLPRPLEGSLTPNGAPGGTVAMTSQPKRPSDFSVDFDPSPYTVAWETTGACALACRSCRARATLRPDSRELTTAEGRRLIDDLVQLGRPMLILTGGDPFMRRDLVDLA